MYEFQNNATNVYQCTLWKMGYCHVGVVFRMFINRRVAFRPIYGYHFTDLVYTWHDDVIKWKHFPRYWPFVRGIHRSPVNSPHKGQWRGTLMFSLICSLNERLSKQSWAWWFETPSCSLWCHCNEWSSTENATPIIFAEYIYIYVNSLCPGRNIFFSILSA